MVDTVSAEGAELSEPAARRSGTAAVPVAVIDGPYDATALADILAQAPVNLGNGSCDVNPASACDHGTFVMGILGARRDAVIPGLCPDCRLLHIPLFMDEHAPSASVGELANAIRVAVAAGARLINLSLAILDGDSQNQRELAAALDYAEASGAVVVVAAGNQGRLAMGQLLSHPVTVPVVAVDAEGRLLPDCNFGPSISRRGVAAFGHQVLGYAPGGGTTVMSGTSVATAVATGTLALLWSARPKAVGVDIRAAVAHLAPPNGSSPPMLNRNVILEEMDRTNEATTAAASLSKRSRMNYVCLQGETTMKDEPGQSTPLIRGASSAATSAHAVIPAHGPGVCACGAPGGICTCQNGGSSPSRFIYVLGSVDTRFPDQSISEELQAVAWMLSHKRGNKSLKEPAKDEDLRSWHFRVLIHSEARYVARQMCWILKVEGQPAYYLALRDLHDLDDLIKCLSHREDDLDLFVGSSSLIPVDSCPGVTAPVLAVEHFSRFEEDQIASWITPSKEALALPPPSKTKASRSITLDDKRKFFKKLVQSADNFGDTDEWRALNYLAVTYQRLYEQYAVMMMNGWIFDSVKVVRSRLWRDKHIVDPVFSFRQIETGLVQKYYVRVDVSHLFPMMIDKIAEYFDR